MRLIVVQPYHAGAVVYPVGVILDVSEADGRRLLADAPDCFRDAGAQAAVIDAPPHATVIRTPRGKRREPGDDH